MAQRKIAADMKGGWNQYQKERKLRQLKFKSEVQTMTRQRLYSISLLLCYPCNVGFYYRITHLAQDVYNVIFM